MGSAGGGSRAPLSRQLQDEAYRFEFFQAVRLLERIAASAGSSRPSEESSPAPAGSSIASAESPPKHPVGRDYAPAQEAVRFRAIVSHAFPAATVAEVRGPQTDARGRKTPSEMSVTFMGLTGPAGVLPQHYTALLIQRIRQKDFTLRDFLDLFNHRVVSLFYRAWEKYRFPIGYERAAGSGDEDAFTGCLYCLVGMGAKGLRRRLEFDDEAFLYYGGLLAHFPRSSVSLERMLADYFEMPTEILQFRGQWLYLSEEDQSALPSARWPRGLNARLGVEVVVGERVWDIEGKFRVRLGPIGYRQFRRLTPAGDALNPLCQMIRCYAGPQFDFDVQPVLKAAEVPWCRLGGDGSDPSHLGWNTWVRSREFDHDVSDAVFSREGLPWTKSA